MAAPNLITYNNWLTQTNRSKWHGQSNKTRSDELEAVDNLIQAYEQDKDPSNLELLSMLLNAWVGGKIKNGNMSTIRDHQGAVTTLKNNVDQALQLNSPVAWDQAYPGIFIAEDLYRGNHWVPDDFKGTVTASLTTIASQPIGKQLLDDISAASTDVKKVVIEYSGAGSAAAPLAAITNDERKKVQKVSTMSPSLNVQQLLSNPDLVATPSGVSADGKTKNFVNAAGTGAVVTWNHKDQGLDGRPAFVALAHELVHAFHYILGNCYRAATGMVSDGQDNGIMEEEMRTVGILKYKNETPSENAIRGEHGINPRTEYGPNISFANVKSSRDV